jgi:acyl carrier protein
MNMSTFEVIQRLAADMLRLPSEQVLRATTLSDAGIDSLSAVDLIFAIERRFSIAIAAEDVWRVRSLRDLAGVVDRLLTRRTHCHEELP